MGVTMITREPVGGSLAPGDDASEVDFCAGRSSSDLAFSSTRRIASLAVRASLADLR
jgi:hypothetical protein